ncbi:MAG: ABC transporter permease [Phycisphaerae bacterium]|nr:ABC transporter permease [Phycisphaerae bacterium]MDW8261179.1 ABC transporter permease [Phycisphaerales bacterium]
MTPQATPSPPKTTLRPSRGWSAVDFREILRFRDLLIVLAGRDIKLRYKQTAIGVAWVLLQPLLASGVFTLVFGLVFGQAERTAAVGLPFFVFAFANQMAWQAFQSTLSKSSASMVGNAHLVSKVYFPRLILPLSTVGSSLLDFAVAVPVLAILMGAYGLAPPVGLVTLPIWLGLILLLATGLGLTAATLTVSYRDVQYILPVLIPFLLYASPVAYPLANVPEHLRIYFYANPLTGLIEAFGWSVHGRINPCWPAVAYSALWAGVTFVFGATLFRRMERRFADVI